MATRIGIGYDTHRLVPGRKLVLGGVIIPHDKGLLGHSDADALLHAVMDAVLGAAGKGDIGAHFPDSDPAYKDISSMALLENVARLLQAEHFTVVNVDSVILAQKPRLAPYIGAMRENIAGRLGVPAALVNVKATTEEGLGFVGAEEGISAQAVVLLETENKG